MRQTIKGLIFTLMLSLTLAVGAAALTEEWQKDKKPPERPVEKPKDDKRDDRPKDDRRDDKKKPNER